MTTIGWFIFTLEFPLIWTWNFWIWVEFKLPMRVTLIFSFEKREWLITVTWLFLLVVLVTNVCKRSTVFLFVEIYRLLLERLTVNTFNQLNNLRFQLSTFKPIKSADELVLRQRAGIWWVSWYVIFLFIIFMRWKELRSFFRLP